MKVEILISYKILEKDILREQRSTLAGYKMKISSV